MGRGQKDKKPEKTPTKEKTVKEKKEATNNNEEEPNEAKKKVSISSVALSEHRHHDQSFSQKEKQTIKSAKRLMWKLGPEFAFMATSFTSTLLVTFYILMGASMMAWQVSISSVLTDSSDVVLGLTDKDEVREVHESVLANQFQLKKTGFVTANGVALFMIVSAVIALINTMIAWRAAVLSLKHQLEFHRWFDFPMVLSGLLAIYWVYGSTDCLDGNDIFERSLLDSFMNFGDFGRSDAVINGIQQSLGCCGVHGPMDYIDNDIRLTGMYATNTRSEGLSFVFPATCCREWWTRNIHCASTVHSYLTAPMNVHNLILFTEKIYTIGCTERAYDVCNQFIWTFKIGMPICVIFFLIHMVIKYFTVIMMLRETKIHVKLSRETRKLGRFDFADDNSSEDDDLTREKRIAQSEAEASMRKQKQMTQDEIQYHKERAQFSKFENILGKSYFRKFIEKARDTTEYATTINYPPPSPTAAPAENVEEVKEQVKFAKKKNYRHMSRRYTHFEIQKRLDAFKKDEEKMEPSEEKMEPSDSLPKDKHRKKRTGKREKKKREKPSANSITPKVEAKIEEPIVEENDKLPPEEEKKPDSPVVDVPSSTRGRKRYRYRVRRRKQEKPSSEPIDLKEKKSDRLADEQMTPTEEEGKPEEEKKPDSPIVDVDEPPTEERRRYRHRIRRRKPSSERKPRRRKEKKPESPTDDERLSPKEEGKAEEEIKPDVPDRNADDEQSPVEVRKPRKKKTRDHNSGDGELPPHEIKRRKGKEPKEEGKAEEEMKPDVPDSIADDEQSSPVKVRKVRKKKTRDHNNGDGELPPHEIKRRKGKEQGVSADDELSPNEIKSRKRISVKIKTRKPTRPKKFIARVKSFHQRFPLRRKTYTSDWKTTPWWGRAV